MRKSDEKCESSYFLLQKVMHTRKRHMELFQELNQKFQTLDRFRDIPNTSSLVSVHRFIGADAVSGIQEWKIEKKKKSPNGALNCTQRQIRNNRILKFFVHSSNVLKYKG